MGKSYVCSDLHGVYELYEKIKEYIQPEDTVYCLGDCGDRGPDGWKLIKAVYADPQFVYLRGNHEEMLVEAMKDWKEYAVKCPTLSADLDFLLDEFMGFSISYRLLKGNGGASTFSSWVRDFMDFSWIEKLSELHVCATYFREDGTRGYLSHAGFTPGTLDLKIGEDFLLWDRAHITHSPSEFKEKDVYVIHGHTPFEYVRKWVDEWQTIAAEWDKPGATVYCKGQKICVDCGTPFTGVASLLDLDTFEEKLFQVEIK